MDTQCPIAFIYARWVFHSSSQSACVFGSSDNSSERVAMPDERRFKHREARKAMAAVSAASQGGGCTMWRANACFIDIPGKFMSVKSLSRQLPPSAQTHAVLLPLSLCPSKFQPRVTGPTEDSFSSRGQSATGSSWHNCERQTHCTSSSARTLQTLAHEAALQPGLQPQRRSLRQRIGSRVFEPSDPTEMPGVIRAGR